MKTRLSRNRKDLDKPSGFLLWVLFTRPLGSSPSFGYELVLRLSTLGNLFHSLPLRTTLGEAERLQFADQTRKIVHTVECCFDGIWNNIVFAVLFPGTKEVSSRTVIVCDTWNDI